MRRQIPFELLSCAKRTIALVHFTVYVHNDDRPLIYYTDSTTFSCSPRGVFNVSNGWREWVYSRYCNCKQTLQHRDCLVLWWRFCVKIIFTPALSQRVSATSSVRNWNHHYYPNVYILKWKTIIISRFFLFYFSNLISQNATNIKSFIQMNINIKLKFF